jgi:hypothetical protein
MNATRCQMDAKRPIDTRSGTQHPSADWDAKQKSGVGTQPVLRKVEWFRLACILSLRVISAEFSMDAAGPELLKRNLRFANEKKVARLGAFNPLR